MCEKSLDSRSSLLLHHSLSLLSPLSSSTPVVLPSTQSSILNNPNPPLTIDPNLKPHHPSFPPAHRDGTTNPPPRFPHGDLPLCLFAESFG